MKKKDLRIKYKALRKNLNTNDLENLSLKIANTLLTLPIWNHTFYHLFLPIVKQNEVNTEFILNILSGKDKNIVVSKSDFKTSSLKHILLMDNTTITLNSYGIPEPVDGIEIAVNKIDVVFTPLLAFDTQGNRVGYGKGFYDKFLSQCKPETIKIGLSFFAAEAEILDSNTNDVSLNYCVTPNKVYKFT